MSMDLPAYLRSEMRKLTSGARVGVPEHILTQHRRPWQQGARLGFDLNGDLCLIHRRKDGFWKATPLTEAQQFDAASNRAPVELLVAEHLDLNKQILPEPGTKANPHCLPFNGKRSKVEPEPEAQNGKAAQLPQPSPPPSRYNTPGDDAGPRPEVAKVADAVDLFDRSTWPMDLKRSHQRALNEQNPLRHHPYKLLQQPRRYAGGAFVLLRSRADSMHEERAGCRHVELLHEHGSFLNTTKAWLALKRLRRSDPETYGANIFTAYISDEWDLFHVEGEPDLRKQSLSRWVETSPGIFAWSRFAHGQNVNQRKAQRHRLLGPLLSLAAHFGSDGFAEPELLRRLAEFLKYCPPHTQRLAVQLGHTGNAMTVVEQLMASISKSPIYFRVTRKNPWIMLEVEGDWLLEAVPLDTNPLPRIAMVKAAETWPQNNGWRLVRLVRMQTSLDIPIPIPALIGGS